MSKDVYVITGMDAIINKENTRPGLNFKDLEHELLSGGMITKKIRDPQERFNEELEKAARSLGISFGQSNEKTAPKHNAANDVSQPTRDHSTTPTPTTQTTQRHSSGGDNGDDSDNSGADGDDNEPEPTENNYKFSDVGRPRFGQSGTADAQQTPHASHGGYNNGASSSYNNGYMPSSSYGADLTARTMEQERRQHIDTIVGNGVSGFSFENEKKEDIKCSMLADIDSLITSLKDESIDLSRIPQVDRNSSFGEVESVLKMLRHKNDHTRYCSFAKEFLIFGAYALEELFDGKRKWFGHYQPDLTGWHNHVQVKVNRIQHDTSKIVSEVMQDYNIGPGARLLLELIPSMIMYSKTRTQQHGEPGLFSDMSMADASRNLRSL